MAEFTVLLSKDSSMLPATAVSNGIWQTSFFLGFSFAIALSIVSSKVCTCGCVVLLLYMDRPHFCYTFAQGVSSGVYHFGSVYVRQGSVCKCRVVHISTSRCVYGSVCMYICVRVCVCVRSGPALHRLLQTHLAARGHDGQPVVHVVADEVTHTLKSVVLCTHLRRHKHIRAVSSSDYKE